MRIYRNGVDGSFGGERVCWEGVCRAEVAMGRGGGRFANRPYGGKVGDGRV